MQQIQQNVAPGQRTRTAALYLLVGLVALLPRVLHLGVFGDSDEINFWLGRSQEFLQAWQTGNLADTAISTHPGVTTMWLGSAGILLRRALMAWGLVEEMTFPLRLALMRMPVALAHVAGILAGYALLRRLFPLHLATLAALLWAADPFVVAYHRILHVDGLTATFATLSLLAACVYWHHQARAGYLILSAACAALAVLSKSPGLAVLPVVGLVAITGQGSEVRGQRSGVRGQGSGVRGRLTLHTSRFTLPVSQLLAWGSVFALTLVIVWPAVWADPLRVYNLLRIGVEVEGSSPHVIGNFFLGREVATPGPLYYPVDLALRTTPLTLAGLLLLPWVWRRLNLSPANRRDLAALAGFIILFVLALSLFPKKLNRYLVPVFPALDILAAVGLKGGIALLLHQGQGPGARGQGSGVRGQGSGVRGHGLTVGLLALLAVLNVAWWHPYSVVAFNQMLGGAPMGARTFLLGDGEGLGQAAEWLNAQPDITGVTVASTMINSFQPFLRHGAQAVSPEGAQLADNTGYVLVYIRHVQRTLRAPFTHFYPQETPLHTVTIHGVEYAWIYQVPPPISHTLNVGFGPHIRLTGYEVDSSALRQTGMLSLTVQWQASAPPREDYLLFAHVLNSSGQRIGQTDAPPAGPDAPASTWQPGRSLTWVHPLPLPPELPSGNYWLALGLYRPGDFARLPIQGGAAPPDAPGGIHNALLLPLEVGE